MRFAILLGSVWSLAALMYSPLVAGANAGPNIVATAAFPETNVFNHVVNGQKNALVVAVENKSNRNVTLLNIAGALLNPETNVIVKNLTSMKYGVPLLENIKLQFPYQFHSEVKPGDHRLTVWVEHSSDDGKFRTDAYDSIVTISDPEFSIFDFKLLSTYLIVAAFFVGVGYIAFRSFVPQTKKPRTKKPVTDNVSAPVGAVKATGAGGYQEEWIPEHHLKKTKAGKKSGALSGTSADELSGAETSGTEARRRKSRK